MTKPLPNLRTLRIARAELHRDLGQTAIVRSRRLLEATEHLVPSPTPPPVE